MNMHSGPGQPPGAPHHYPSPHGYPADPTQLGYPPGAPHLHMGPHGGEEHMEDVNEHEHDDSEGHVPGETSPDQPPKRKRRRQALSCTECKRRKIKCDRANPCGPCSRRGDEAKCKWHIIEPVEKFVTRSEYDELRRKFEALEHAVAQLSGRPLAAIYQPGPGMPAPWVIPPHMGEPDPNGTGRPVGVIVDPNLQTADVAAAITNANNAIASSEAKKPEAQTLSAVEKGERLRRKISPLPQVQTHNQIFTTLLPQPTMRMLATPASVTTQGQTRQHHQAMLVSPITPIPLPDRLVHRWDKSCPDVVQEVVLPRPGSTGTDEQDRQPHERFTPPCPSSRPHFTANEHRTHRVPAWEVHEVFFTLCLCIVYWWHASAAPNLMKVSIDAFWDISSSKAYMGPMAIYFLLLCRGLIHRESCGQ